MIHSSWQSTFICKQPVSNAELNRKSWHIWWFKGTSNSFWERQWPPFATKVRVFFTLCAVRKQKFVKKKMNTWDRRAKAKNAGWSFFHFHDMRKLRFVKKEWRLEVGTLQRKMLVKSFFDFQCYSKSTVHKRKKRRKKHHKGAVYHTKLVWVFVPLLMCENILLQNLTEYQKSAIYSKK